MEVLNFRDKVSMPKQPSYSYSPDGSFLASCFRINELLHKASQKKEDESKPDKKKKRKTK